MAPPAAASGATSEGPPATDVARAEPGMGNGTGGRLGAVAVANIAWLATLALIFLVAIRVLLVAKLDAPTAAALLVHSSTVTIAVAVLISAVPALLVSAAVMVGYYLCSLNGASRQRSLIPVLATQAGLILLSVMVTPLLTIGSVIFGLFCCSRG
jgi:hypothetical protein